MEASLSHALHGFVAVWRQDGRIVWVGWWLDGCMHRCMDEWMQGFMNGWMDGWMDEWMEGGREGWRSWMDGWMDGWMAGWMDGCMEGWLDGPMVCWLVAGAPCRHRAAFLRNVQSLANGSRPWWLPGGFRLNSEGIGLALEPLQRLCEASGTVG